MPTLTQYTQATQRLLHDPTGASYPTSDLTVYINETRTQLALDAECVRFNFGADGIAAIGNFTSGSPNVLNVSPAAANVSDTITGWIVVNPGPVPAGTTVVSYTGTTLIMSANATTNSNTDSFIISPPNKTVTLQEVYPYLQITPGGTNPTAYVPVCATNGINNIIAVKNVSVNWGGYGGSNQYTLEQWGFTNYQAFLGFYGPNIRGNPCVWTAFQNSVRLRPIPSQVVPMQWDCVCSVLDLVNDTTPDALPPVFTDAVKYHAAYLALMNSQNPGNAENMFKLYERYRNRARQFVQRTFTPYLYR
jgi:hypothetical protein